MATEPSRIEANRLYWETDAPVARIAETLGISRRALYELLDRVPADQPCPECGGPVLFTNRLARSTGEAQCGACGATTVVPTVRARDPDARLAGAAVEAVAADGGKGADSGGAAGEEGAYPAPGNPPPTARGPADALRDPRLSALAGAVLLGLLAGVGATLLITRRRR